jgi:hypothetical protein
MEIFEDADSGKRMVTAPVWNAKSDATSGDGGWCCDAARALRDAACFENEPLEQDWNWEPLGPATLHRQITKMQRPVQRVEPSIAISLG